MRRQRIIWRISGWDRRKNETPAEIERLNRSQKRTKKYEIDKKTCTDMVSSFIMQTGYVIYIETEHFDGGNLFCDILSGMMGMDN